MLLDLLQLVLELLDLLVTVLPPVVNILDVLLTAQSPFLLLFLLQLFPFLPFLALFFFVESFHFEHLGLPLLLQLSPFPTNLLHLLLFFPLVLLGLLEVEVLELHTALDLGVGLDSVVLVE